MSRLTKISRAMMAGAAVAALAGPASAQDSDFTWSANLGATSDYMFRGVSQTDNDPAISGGLDIGYGLFYAGVWASKVDEGFVATGAEIDVYAGIKPVWGKVTFDFAVLGYLYPDQDEEISGGLEVNYLELKAAASVAVTDQVTVGAAYYYSPEYTFETGESHAIEGNFAISLPKFWVFDPALTGAVGYFESDIGSQPADRNGADLDGDGAPDLQESITYWNVGLALTVEAITFDLRYWGSDIDNALTDDRFVFSTKLVLP